MKSPNERTLEDLVKLGARRIQEERAVDGPFMDRSETKVTAVYDGGIPATYERGRTQSLGPVRFFRREGTVEVVVASEAGYLIPNDVSNLIDSMSMAEIRALVYDSPTNPIERDGIRLWVTGLNIREEVMPNNPHGLRRHQWVRHRILGVGQLQGFMLGDGRQATIKFEDSEATEVVYIADLVPHSHLGARWSFDFGPSSGGHRHVAVRSGTEHSRALLGTLIMNDDEAAAFRVVAQAMGAVVKG